MFTAVTLTLSDRSYEGSRIDESGKVLQALLKEGGYKLGGSHLLPDEEQEIERLLVSICDEQRPDLILTTGGTGIARRDVTPEATARVIEKELPGMMEWARMKSMEVTSRAMLSRGLAGTRGKTLIINFPGSPKACKEYFAYLSDAIPHALGILRGELFECADDASTKDSV